MDNYSSDPMTVLDKKSEYCKVITINPVGNMNMCTKCHPVVKEKKHKYVSLMVVIQKKTGYHQQQYCSYCGDQEWQQKNSMQCIQHLYFSLDVGDGPTD